MGFVGSTLNSALLLFPHLSLHASFTTLGSQIQPQFLEISNNQNDRNLQTKIGSSHILEGNGNPT